VRGRVAPTLACGLRFTLQAIVRILFLRRYKAKLRFLPLPVDDVSSRGLHSSYQLNMSHLSH